MIAIRAHRAEWSDEFWLLVCQENHEGRITAFVPEGLTLKEHKHGDMIGEPTLRLPADAARRLMDELWRLGVRPSNGEGSAGQLAATEKHLADMRRLVFEEPKTVLRESR